MAQAWPLWVSDDGLCSSATAGPCGSPLSVSRLSSHFPFLAFLSYFPGGFLHFRFRPFHPTAQLHPACAESCFTPERSFLQDGVPSAWWAGGVSSSSSEGRMLAVQRLPPACPVSGSLLRSRQTRTRGAAQLEARQQPPSANGPLGAPPAPAAALTTPVPRVPVGTLHPTVSCSAFAGVPPSPTRRVWDLLAAPSSSRWAPAPAAEAAGLCRTRPSAPLLRCQ